MTTDVPAPQERVIRPTRRRIRLSDLPKHAQLIRFLTFQAMRLSYRQSALGALWLVFQPLALLVAFFVAFSGSQSAGINHAPYLLFALVGLCVWSYFQAAVVNGAVSIIGNEHLVRRTPCPRIAFPIASAASRLPILALVLFSTVVVVIARGMLTARVFLLPVAIVWLIILTLGVVWLVSAAAVFFRDTLNAVPLLVQAGAFLAPVGYSTSKFKPALRTLVDLNPMTGVIEFWRWMLIGGAFPSPLACVAAISGTVLALTVGWTVFRRCEPTMADVI